MPAEHPFQNGGRRSDQRLVAAAHAARQAAGEDETESRGNSRQGANRTVLPGTHALAEPGMTADQSSCIAALRRCLALSSST